jgi:hypothetical protein
MRTKTMLLSGVVAALSGASLMAQVYSLNAVGYINVTIPVGFSVIADQLYATNQSTPQFISPLLDAQLLDGNHIGVTLNKWNTNTQTYVAMYVQANNTWNSTTVNSVTSVPATNTTLNPGEAVLIYNPASVGQFTMTFVGQVPQGNLTVQLGSGLNMVSSVVPQTGYLDTNLFLTPAVGDTMSFYDPATQSFDQIYYWTPTLAWGPSGTSPYTAVGQGFFYYANVASGTSENWVRTFNVN